MSILFSEPTNESATEPTTNPTTLSMASVSATYALKSTLRRSMLRTLRSIPDPELERQSVQVARMVIEQPWFKTASTVGCYLSMIKGELRTLSIVSEILNQKKTLYTPYLPDGAGSTSSPDWTPNMRMLRLYSPADLGSCPLDKWGILDPGEKRYDGDGGLREDAMNTESPALDLILVPGVAFDENCERLGRGKAYYDTFLQEYTSTRPRPLLVALALEPQVLPPGQRVPTTPGDFQLDGVVSPAGIIWRDGVRS